MDIQGLLGQLPGPGQGGYLDNSAVQNAMDPANQYRAWLNKFFGISPEQAGPDMYQMWMAERQGGGRGGGGFGGQGGGGGFGAPPVDPMQQLQMQWMMEDRNRQQYLEEQDKARAAATWESKNKQRFPGGMNPLTEEEKDALRKRFSDAGGGAKTGQSSRR